MMSDEELCPSCREPLSYPSGDGCASMTAHSIEEPFHIAVEKVVEHEDGGATYSFEMDERAAVNMAQIGLEFTVFCAAYQLDLQYVLNNLAYLAEKRDNSENDK